MAIWKPVAGFRDRPEQLAIEARSDSGATLGTGEGALGDDGTGVARVEVPAGDITLRYSARGASGEVVDRWEELINVPDLSGATFAIASPTFIRGRTTVSFQALRKGQPGAPSPDREFRTSDLIVVRAAVAGSGDGNPQVTAEVLTRQGKPLAKWPASLVAGEHQVELPVRALALGEYVLRFTAQRSGETAVTTAAFAIVR
jgi:hypothetical protein